MNVRLASVKWQQWSWFSFLIEESLANGAYIYLYACGRLVELSHQSTANELIIARSLRSSLSPSHYILHPISRMLGRLLSSVPRECWVTHPHLDTRAHTHTHTHTHARAHACGSMTAAVPPPLHVSHLTLISKRPLGPFHPLVKLQPNSLEILYARMLRMLAEMGVLIIGGGEGEE